jgi:predicted transcriptional regulator
MSPPRVLTILEHRQVCVTGPDEPISTVLGHVVGFDYSQVPVYGDTGHVSLLTTNAIARWLAHQLELNHGLAEGEPVHRILTFAEAHEHARLADHTITAAEAIYHLTHSERRRAPVPALIVTEDGEPASRPLRMITSSDLPALQQNLGSGSPGQAPATDQAATVRLPYP